MERFALSQKGREMTALLVVMTTFLFLFGGLIKLQILDYQELSARSENNRIRVVPIVPTRGLVFDRNGKILIDSRPSYTVSVIPVEEVAGVTLPMMAELIGLDTIQIRKRIRRNYVSRYQPAAVKRDVGLEVVAILEEQNDRYPGISYQVETVRKYADGLGAESFTGYVGEVSSEDVAREGPVDYRLGSMIGKKGLERYYDLLLRGIEGTEYIEVSASGQIIGSYEGRKRVPPIDGADLTLGIDMDLQRACVNALDTFCCGAIVALDPRNGEVLAMTSYPGYDANIFSSVIPSDLWQAITADSSHPLLNRPMNGLYPPGSTLKFIVAGAGLEMNQVTRNTTMKSCYGGFQFGNRWFGCWKDGGHGALSAVRSLEQSCDVYFYQLGLRLGIDELHRFYDLCGFGSVTGIDLPGESPGLNPSTEYYDKRYGVNKWTRGLTLNISIGQGELLATPLQIAQFFCGLANDGTVYRPHFIKSVTEPSGSERIITPQVSFRFPFSRETMDVLREGLRLVVEGKDGTAKSLKNNSYSIGGKTGTAQNPHGENHSWFIGVAPLENPEIVVCAIVENAGHGSDVAAPLVGQIIQSYLASKTAPADVASVDEGEAP